MPTETENPKTDEVGTTDGEAVQVAESAPETAQNEPKIARTPSGESGQLGVIDPIASVETSAGEGVVSEPILAQAETVEGATAPSLQAVTPEPRSGENTAGVIIPRVAGEAVPRQTFVVTKV